MDKNHGFKIRTFDGGSVIFNPGDPADAVYAVISGAVEIRHQTGNAGAQTVAILRKGDVFGELAMIEARRHQASAVTLEKTEVVVIPHQDFVERLINLDPIMRAVILQLVERLRETTHDLETAKQGLMTGFEKPPGRR